MKYILFSVVLNLLMTNAICQITFQRSYGMGLADRANSVVTTYDGKYVILGSTDTHTFQNSIDLYLIKTDVYGDTIWTKRYGDTGPDEGYSLQQTSDSCLILAGYMNSSAWEDFYLVKTDSLGDTLWTKHYGNSNIDRAYTVCETYDRGFVAAGMSYNSGTASLDAYVIKVDSIGNLLWAKTYGGTGDDCIYSVIESPDSGLIYTGYTESFGTLYPDLLLFKTDSNGNVMWTNVIGGMAADLGMSILKTQNNQLIISGASGSFGSNIQYDFFIIKTDLNGDTIWTKSYGATHNDILYSACETNDSCYMLAGVSYYGGDYRSYLAKIDRAGNLLWGNVGPQLDSDSRSCIRKAAFEGYIIAASTYYNGANANDAFLIKANSNGFSGCSEVPFPYTSFTTLPGITHPNFLIGAGGLENHTNTVISTGCWLTTMCSSVHVSEIETVQQNLSLFPNPFNSEFIIRNSAVGTAGLYDLAGKEILRKITQDGETKIITTGISAGYYILKYYNGYRIENYEVIKTDN